MLATTYLTWWRRRWRGELPTQHLPEAPAADEFSGVELRQVFGAALAGLPRRQRAVLMLRFHADLTEAETARTLGISIGTVKSCTSRALSKLRADPRLRELIGVGT
jgi:RNA polymerase sigma factor (sigma-70 family)